MAKDGPLGCTARLVAVGVCRAYGTHRINGTLTQHCRAGLTYTGPTAL